MISFHKKILFVHRSVLSFERAKNWCCIPFRASFIVHFKGFSVSFRHDLDILQCGANIHLQFTLLSPRSVFPVSLSLFQQCIHSNGCQLKQECPVNRRISQYQKQFQGLLYVQQYGRQKLIGNKKISKIILQYIKLCL